MLRFSTDNLRKVFCDEDKYKNFKKLTYDLNHGNDIYDLDNCFGINFLDTYSNWIQTTNDKDSKHFSLIRADVFIIYYSSWRQMTNVESQDD